MKLAALIAAALLASAAAFGETLGVPAEEKNSPPAAEKPRTPFVPAEQKFSRKPVALLGEQLFIVETKVNGVPAKMLLDTGASHTTLDLNWAKAAFPQAQTKTLRAGDASNAYSVAPQEIRLLPIEKFSVGENHFGAFRVPLADLSGLRAALPELRDVAGILGMNTVTLAPCRISFKNRTLRWLSAEDAAQISPKEKLRSRVLPGTDCVLVTIFSPKNGAPLEALIDCGALDTSVLADFWTEELPEKIHSVVTTHAGTRVAEIAFGVPETLKFSETFALENVSPKIIPADSVRKKVLLGTDALSRFDLVLADGGNAVFAAPTE